MLKSRKAMDKLFRSGKSITLPPLRLHYQVEDSIENQPYVKVGVGVGKKYFKKAVDRNRIKRLMREAYRINKHALNNITASESPLHLNIFFLFNGREMPDYRLIFDKMSILIEKLENRLKEQKKPENEASE